LLLLLGDELVHSVQAVVLGLPELLKRILGILGDHAAAMTPSGIKKFAGEIVNFEGSLLESAPADARKARLS